MIYRNDDPPAESYEDPCQDIARAIHDEKTITGYGRSQHGMNGKDADLDNEGQCVVESVAVIDPVRQPTMFVEIVVNRYANICPASDDEDETRDEELKDASMYIVMDRTDYPGEWSDDYWTYSGGRETIRVPLSLTEYERGDKPYIHKRLAARCAKAIYASKEGRAFEKFAATLNNDLNNLHKEVA